MIAHYHFLTTERKRKIIFWLAILSLFTHCYCTHT